MLEKNYRVLSLLKAMFPKFEYELEKIYWKDAVFREIAREYIECINKQEMLLEETGTKLDVYTDTISELKLELLSYLDKADSNKKDQKY
jgi:hypothetical protein